MPKKKIELTGIDEVDEVVEEPKKEKTYIQRWFDNHAGDDRHDLSIVCQNTYQMMGEQFSIWPEDEDDKIYAVMYYVTFMTILSFLKKEEKKNKEFSMRIAKSLNIGYVNNDDTDNEKVGNFMPFMEYCGINRNIVETEDVISDENQTERNCIRWLSLNTKKNADYYNAIQTDSAHKLNKDFGVGVGSGEMIFPEFGIFQDNIVNLVKNKFASLQGTDTTQVKMNVFGLYKIYYSYDEEDGKEIIEYEPTITMKKALKSDDIASRE